MREVVPSTFTKKLFYFPRRVLKYLLCDWVVVFSTKYKIGFVKVIENLGQILTQSLSIFLLCYFAAEIRLKNQISKNAFAQKLIGALTFRQIVLNSSIAAILTSYGNILRDASQWA
jgi:hypothetical protein